MSAEIHLFDNDPDLKPYAAGETIFKAGDIRDFMYVVVQGEVDLVVNGVNVETVKAGGIFGEMALIEHDERIATATARTDCRLATVDERRFSFMLRETPYFALTVMKILAQRLRRMDMRLRG